MRFGERLKELRLEKGLTQQKLAEIFSVKQNTIVSWEQGVNETDFATLIQLAKFFDVSTDYILGIEN
ncbi:MAG: helix-turn-helix domain-containing protein [Clostridiaceae bacterium]|jgi:transcriptional regulator with XRE-family HTH domain|nr:helix-turn-helix domain-containing protein [Clostridiaceae bacterium]